MAQNHTQSCILSSAYVLYGSTPYMVTITPKTLLGRRSKYPDRITRTELDL